MNKNDMSFEELVDLYLSQKNLYMLEGSTGVKNLEKLLKAIEGDSFFGNPIVDFLENNPGAIEAIINWIKEEGGFVDDWVDSLKEAVDDSDDEDE